MQQYVHAFRHTLTERSAIFQLNTKDANQAYMSVSRSPYNNNRRFIVMVDASRFLQLWRSVPDSIERHNRVAFGGLDEWESDYKYPAAAQGFEYGFNNPVPLAKVACNTLKQDLVYYRTRILGIIRSGKTVIPAGTSYVGFTNGITRTIWLLSKDVEFFPVETYRDCAELLAELAGVTPNAFCSVEQLMPEQRWDNEIPEYSFPNRN